MRLTKRHARRFLCALHFEDAEAKGLSRAERVVRHVRKRGCVQYDPIDVVGRNADLVLQSRVDGYKPQDLLRALYDERALIVRRYFKSHTQTEIDRDLGVSQVQVSRLENKIVEKLRRKIS